MSVRTCKVTYVDAGGIEHAVPRTGTAGLRAWPITNQSKRWRSALRREDSIRHGAPVGFARVAVADVRREEIDEAARCMLAAGGDQRGYIPRGSRGGGKLVHK